MEFLWAAKNDDETRKYIINKNILKKGEKYNCNFGLNFSDKGGILGYKDPSKPIGLYPEDGDEASNFFKWIVEICLYRMMMYLPWGNIRPSYQPFGDLFLNFNVEESKVNNYKRMLDPDD